MIQDLLEQRKVTERKMIGDIEYDIARLIGCMGRSSRWNQADDHRWNSRNRTAETRAARTRSGTRTKQPASWSTSRWSQSATVFGIARFSWQRHETSIQSNSRWSKRTAFRRRFRQTIAFKWQEKSRNNGEQTAERTDGTTLTFFLLAHESCSTTCVGQGFRRGKESRRSSILLTTVRVESLLQRLIARKK